MQKQILTAVIIAVLTTALITASLTASTAEAKKDKDKTQTCKNIKVQVKVNGLEENDTIIGSAHLDNKTLGKTATVEINETGLTLAFNFKKLDPCPPLGSEITGFVNGTDFSGELKSIKKPNKISMDF